LPTRRVRPLRPVAQGRGGLAAGDVLRVPVAAVGRAPGGAVRPAGAQVPRIRADVLAAGLHLPGDAAGDPGAAAVLRHRAGRPACGDACPQTVWTEVFLWVERWTEGDRPQRMKLDAGPWTREKVLRKGAKHALWLVFALWTGFTFVGFFTPITGLGARVWPFDWNGWEVFWVLFYAL